MPIQKTYDIQHPEGEGPVRLVIWNRDEDGVQSIDEVYASMQMSELIRIRKERHPNVPYWRDVKRLFRVEKTVTRVLWIDVLACDQEEAIAMAEQKNLWAEEERQATEVTNVEV